MYLKGRLYISIIVKNQTIKTYGHKIQCLKNNQMISPKYYVHDYNLFHYQLTGA
jgi:hypothetical protein